MKNATKFWICEKVKDFLIVDATLGAAALANKLKEHHKVNINYKRVYDGNELALNNFMVTRILALIFCSSLKHKLRVVAMVA